MKTPSHRFYEDVLAIFCAGILVALGVELFNTHGLLAGGTAGIALLSANLLPMGFGTLFFLVNVPFYFLAWTQVGKRFTVNTFISVTTVSVLTENVHKVITISEVHPVFAAMAGGILIGVGLLIMFRHKSSLGGLGILALYMQNRFNIRAGTFQLGVDCSILAFSAVLFPIELVLLSILGAITLNILIAVNHKPGRYQLDSIDQESIDMAGIEADVFEEMNQELLSSAK